MDGVYALYYDLVVITIHIREYKIQRLMVDEGSDPTLPFANY